MFLFGLTGHLLVSTCFMNESCLGFNVLFQAIGLRLFHFSSVIHKSVENQIESTWIQSRACVGSG